MSEKQGPRLTVGQMLALKTLGDGGWHYSSTGNGHGGVNWQAARNLYHQGFADWHTGDDIFRITDAGREVLAAAYEVHSSLSVRVEQPGDGGERA